MKRSAGFARRPSVHGAHSTREKASSAGLPARVSWSGNFQTPLFLQELSKGEVVPEWSSWGGVLYAPGTRVDSALVRGALQWERMGNPALNSVRNAGGNQPLMGFTELSPGSLTVSAASHFTPPAAFCSLPSLQRGYEREGRGRWKGGKAERAWGWGGEELRGPISIRSDGSRARVLATPPSCLPSNGPSRLFSNSQNFQPNVSHIQEPK